MKKLLILILLAGIPFLSSAQSCDKTAAASCDKTSCGPEGTKKGEAKVITTLRSDVEDVIRKMSRSPIHFDKQVADMKVIQGSNDDESLLFLSQAVSSIRYEFLSKVEPSKLIAPLRAYKPAAFTTKQQMVSALKEEISMLSNQAEKL